MVDNYCKTTFITDITIISNTCNENIVRITFLYNGYVSPSIIKDIINMCCGKHILNIQDDDDQWIIECTSMINPEVIDYIFDAINSLDVALKINSEFRYEQYRHSLAKYM